MMKISIFCLALLLVSCGNEKEKDSKEKTEEKKDSTQSEDKTEKKVRQSPKLVAELNDENNAIKIDYSSPQVKGRTVWGELVPFDKVWRAGANETTALTIEKDIQIQDSTLAAGTYGVFIIPKENGPWTIVFNKEWSKELHGSWGSYNYNEEKDAARFDVDPIHLDESVEDLTYEVNNSAITFSWSDKKLELPYTNK